MWTRVRDVVAALVLGAATAVPGTGGVGAQIGDLPVRPLDAAGVLLGVLMWLPLAVRVRFPLACLAVTGAAFAGHEIAGYPPTVATLAVYAALYAAGAHADRHRRTATVAGIGAYAVFAAALAARGSAEPLGVYVLFGLALAACAAVGTAVRARRLADADRERRAAGAAAARERQRIARELHDVVTHHVTAMVVQADAAGFLVGTDPERATATLDTIAATGRRALADLRDLLDVLRPADTGAEPTEPAPGRIATLVDGVRAAGQPVEFTERGPAGPIGDAAALAAYRVVQEALTNAMKHAPGRRTEVLIVHEEQEIRIDVGSAGPGAGPVESGRRPGGGHGLAGLAARVERVGGRFAAGVGDDGGFRVTARIPRQAAP
jgi:signal transduction histidine kinase